MSLRVFHWLRCPWCLSEFWVCVVCFRGHVYCGPACRKQAREASCSKARRKHEASEEGRADHAQRQRDYLDRKREGERVTDHGSEDLAQEQMMCAPTAESSSTSLESSDGQQGNPPHEDEATIVQATSESKTERGQTTRDKSPSKSTSEHERIPLRCRICGAIGKFVSLVSGPKVRRQRSPPSSCGDT